MTDTNAGFNDLRYAGPPRWMEPRYHTAACNAAECDPSCDIGVPAWPDGTLYSALHLCPLLGRTIAYDDDGLSKCGCRARVPSTAHREELKP